VTREASAATSECVRSAGKAGRLSTRWFTCAIQDLQRLGPAFHQDEGGFHCPWITRADPALTRFGQSALESMRRRSKRARQFGYVAVGARYDGEHLSDSVLYQSQAAAVMCSCERLGLCVLLTSQAGNHNVSWRTTSVVYSFSATLGCCVASC
jgi:hypothetical protein